MDAARPAFDELLLLKRETVAIAARADTETAFERSAECIAVVESDRFSNCLNSVARNEQASACFVQSQLVDEVRRRSLKQAFEDSAEMTRAKTGSLRQAFDGKFVLEMRQNPTGQIGESIGWRGLPGSRLKIIRVAPACGSCNANSRATVSATSGPKSSSITRPSSRCRRGCRRRCRIARPSGTSPCSSCAVAESDAPHREQSASVW